MGYRSEVALVMPYGDWLELKFQARQSLKDNDTCPYETSIFEDVEEIFVSVKTMTTNS